MFIEYPRRVIAPRPLDKKVEPIESPSEDHPMEKYEEEAVIVEIIYEDEDEEEKKLPKEYHDRTTQKHTLSIWV